MAKETQEQRAIAKAVTEEEVRLRIAQKQFAEQLSEGIYAGDNKLGLVDDKVADAGASRNKEQALASLEKAYADRSMLMADDRVGFGAFSTREGEIRRIKHWSDEGIVVRPDAECVFGSVKEKIMSCRICKGQAVKRISNSETQVVTIVCVASAE